MSLTPGSRIGPYEIIAPIGAGGMGEVLLPLLLFLSATDAGPNHVFVQDLGGMPKHRWTWSGIACPSTNSTPCWLHQSLMIFLIPARSEP